jgi:2'-5' RNA ligase
MQCGPGSEPINSYALVTYIPDPLGRFLDDLRRELAPDSEPRAHVTILPPRSLAVTAELAWAHVFERIRNIAPFTVEIDDVKIFEFTDVIYLELRSGAAEMTRMHHELNAAGPVHSNEVFEYHPHITLAQDLPRGEVLRVYERACACWAGYCGSRSFAAETVTFVQNTRDNRWKDLAQVTLGAVSVS